MTSDVNIDQVKIGIIVGSDRYDMEGLEETSEVSVSTHPRIALRELSWVVFRASQTPF